jgi:hypothetical protein
MYRSIFDRLPELVLVLIDVNELVMLAKGERCGGFPVARTRCRYCG